MIDGLALALGAGLLAAINPCGFALLPAYLTLLVLDEGSSRGAAVRRALISTAYLTLGFVAVFGVFGLAISPVASGLQQYLPWVTVVLGIALVAGGVWLLAGRALPAFGWSPHGPALQRRAASMIGFGATYALASLTCTIAPFLVVVVASFRSGSVVQGASLFVAYGLGMGLLVGAAALAVALARDSMIARLRRLGGAVPRLAGALLVFVGAYVAYYGWWEIRVLRGGAPADPVVGFAGYLQAQLSSAVSAIGAVGVVVILAGLGIVALTVRHHHRARSGASAEAPATDS